MTQDTSQADDWCDRALALIMADGAAALRLVDTVVQRSSADAHARARAHGLRALVELREGQVEAGRQALQEAEALVDPTRHDDRLTDLLQHMRAQWHRREGRLDEAEALLQALHERAALRSTVEAYQTAGSLGIVVSMRGDDERALDLFYQALSLARRSGEDSLIVNALNNLGSLQSDLYNLEDAGPLLQECLAGALRLNSHRLIIFAAGNLVQCLCLIGQTEQALALAREHLIQRIRPDDLPALHRDEEIAQALLDNDLVDEAEAALGGQAHVDPMSNELGTVRVWLDARILLARGKADQALQLGLAWREKMHRQGKEGTPAIDRVSLLRVTAQAADQVGEHALAYRLLDEAMTLHEQLLGRAARSRQLSLQITHRLQHAEWERDAAQQMAARLEALNGSLQAQIAETERLQQRLRAQALEDPLTGLHNRRHLLDAGAAMLSLMRRRGEPVAVVLVDLDHFKRVNDQHGHDAGDRVLRGFAELARREMRAEDLVCRYGGEEFVLLLPGAQAAQAAARIEQLLRQFRAMRFEGAHGALFASSYSAGVATPIDADDTLPALLSRADQALYAAKDAGRDRVHVADAPSNKPPVPKEARA